MALVSNEIEEAIFFTFENRLAFDNYNVKNLNGSGTNPERKNIICNIDRVLPSLVAKGFFSIFQ